jgi:hypothetical protein
MRRAHALLYEDELKTCAVCDEASFTSPPLPWKPERHTTVALDAMPPHAYECLLPPEDNPLHDDLLAQYNVTSLAPPETHNLISNLLLSPRGITEGKATICNTCHHSLQQDHLPKLAIANGSAKQLPQPSHPSTHDTLCFYFPSLLSIALFKA